MGYLRLAKEFQLSDYAYAHRGLWSKDGLPENSMKAFLAAATSGLGIEFDVRPSADGVPVVFHDKTLDRMTNEFGLVEERSASELIRIELVGGGVIPTLQELLEAWPTDAPLLCEMKIDGLTNPVEFALTVAKQLIQYNKPAAAMSFSWAAVSAIPQSVMRGQLIDASERIGADKFRELSGKAIEPHCNYIACHVSDAKRLETSLPFCVWTVKDAETSMALQSTVPAQIFEGFDPELVKHNSRHT